MKTAGLSALILALAVSGCAAPRFVERSLVAYNEAIGSVTDSLVLLNIVRAKEDMPLHHTSLSRLTGGMGLSADSGASGILQNLSRTLSGTISLGGGGGPSFDVAIGDTQKFYQGALSSVPVTTIESMLNEGFDNQLIIRLLVERVEFPSGVDGNASSVTLHNAASGPQAAAFVKKLSCYALRGTSGKKVKVAPLSRVTHDAKGEPIVLRLDDLLALDGKRFELSGDITEDHRNDRNLVISRVGINEQEIRLVRLPHCVPFAAMAARGRSPASVGPPRGSGQAPAGASALASEGQGSLVDEVSEAVITFRSPQGVIRHLGRYLRAMEDAPDATYSLRESPLFSVQTARRGRTLASASLLGRNYYVLDDEHRRRNMTVISLVEQLFGLQKDSSDRPSTIPVQVVR